MATHPAMTVRSIIRAHPYVVAVTWFMVAVENILMVLLPLLIGFSIDGLLNHDLHDFKVLAITLLLLVIVSVVRRFYDTRAYGTMRVNVGKQVARDLQHCPITRRNARLTMSRELVDFLEHDLPPLLTALIQLIASIVILAGFHPVLALHAGGAALAMLLTYACFHRHFMRLNTMLNNQLERQVKLLSLAPGISIRSHLQKLRTREIYLSDTEALTYGLIFLILFGFVLANLWQITHTAGPSAGELFAIVSYSLEFVEAAILLPTTLQTLSRLSEISQRLSTHPLPGVES
ncbi:ABC transporter six-transmembrane domain-containing protein [Photobacterium sp. TY1-4]|uniref:ABC transporter six-transmembrane domain-containing protein n=1 Tax=Photobacterium sp. TY1-4 TaxID=2899122 RepID=UPI0021BF5914|nr:ABC transporter six-transmembrane domain-containing protein [Photobacterium sp. TY1-4]UXI03584.1 ABC transporter six-transmembrane domain-containing protein [Photobacterium sp. TY1-4]